MNKTHPWHKASMFKKRINGFLCYQLSSFLSLINPIMADRVMYKTLKEQFENVTPNKNQQPK